MSTTISAEYAEVTLKTATSYSINSNPSFGKLYGSTEKDWLQKGDDIDGGTASERSGQGISISADGSIIAIGAYSYDGTDGSTANVGVVRIYEWNGSSWVRRGYDILGVISSDSGWDLSLSADGSILAIGAYRYDGVDGNSTSIGYVRVYEWNGTEWDQRGLDIVGKNSGDEFGYAISLSNDGLVFAGGARSYDGPDGMTQQGAVRVYEWNGSSWIQRGDDIYGEAKADNFGGGLHLNSDGSVLAAGSSGNDGQL